jgi:hypothetical protein
MRQISFAEVAAEEGVPLAANAPLTMAAVPAATMNSRRDTPSHWLDLSVITFLPLLFWISKTTHVTPDDEAAFASSTILFLVLFRDDLCVSHTRRWISARGASSPRQNADVILAAPPYVSASGPRGTGQGIGDWPLFLVKYRLAYANENNGDYIVTGGAPDSAVAAADERPDWSTPVLTEVFGEEKDRLLKNLAKIAIEKTALRKPPRLNRRTDVRYPNRIGRR